MTRFVRPGPVSLPAGLAPGGLVLQVYSHPEQVFLFQRLLPAHVIETDLLDHAAHADGEATATFLEHVGGRAIVVVVYDGDTGQRIHFPPGTTMDDLEGLHP